MRPIFTSILLLTIICLTATAGMAMVRDAKSQMELDNTVMNGLRAKAMSGRMRFGKRSYPGPWSTDNFEPEGTFSYDDIPYMARPLWYL
ncbi:hypothetical protein AB6A40_003247 [Gnathostoma spinigerum]|uniref:Uncharacterized protein n=1 Tax=Gnathostoma spinigerum TaxID=75299 RepID=A0ABD6E8Z2_9BILA